MMIFASAWWLSMVHLYTYADLRRPGAWRHQAFTWTNVDFSLARFCCIHTITTSQQVFMNLNRTCIRITLLNLLPHISQEPMGQYLKWCTWHTHLQRTRNSHCLHSKSNYCRNLCRELNDNLLNMVVVTHRFVRSNATACPGLITWQDRAEMAPLVEINCF